MKALLIVAHGSRKKDANHFLEKLTAEMDKGIREPFSRVSFAYIQFSGPFAADRIAELVKEGIRQIVIFPFFLSEGGHVTQDIPELIRQAEKEHPGVVFETTPFLGRIPGLKELILDAVTPG